MRGFLLIVVILNLLLLALRLPAYPALPWIATETLLLTGTFALLPPGRLRRVSAYSLGGLYSILALCAAADALTRQSLGRDFNVYLDAGLVGSVWDQLVSNLGNTRALLAAAAISLAMAALAVLVGYLLERLGPRGKLHRKLAVAALVIGAVMLIPGVARQLPVATTALGIIKTQATLAKATHEATAEFEERLASPGRQARGQARQGQPLAGLIGKDVIVGFIESYGTSTLTDPRYAPLIESRLQQMAQALDAAGLHVASGRLRSPVQGGQSWLAHATLLSGQWVDSQLDYEILLASGYPTLIDDFSATGHETVAVMPAITRDWPEGRRFGYDRILDADALAYEGPPLNWVTMPDQYTWSRFQRAVREDANRPIFAEVALTSSHAPWVPVIEVLQEWDSIGSGKVFNRWKDSGESPEQLWQDHDRVREHYARAIDYALEVVTAYAVRYVDDSTLLVVVGDHQAAPLITGRNAGRDVPIHLISADPDLLAPFITSRPEKTATIFRPGTRPDMSLESAGMDAFRQLLHSAFSRPHSPGP